MRWVLRRCGATRKRFSRLPHWAKDIYGLLSYANFIELVPTLVCIALAPRHFFRRLPRTLSGHQTLYKTPIKFAFNFATFFLAMFFLRHGDLGMAQNATQTLWVIPAILVLTPFAMIGLGIISWVLYQIPRLAPNGDAFPTPNNGPFKLLLSPRTYMTLDPKKFVWGLFYISVYFLAVWQVVQVLIAVDLLGVIYLVGALGDGHLIPKVITVLLGIAIVAFSIHGLVLHPYMEMLRACLRRPTRHVYESDVFQIRQRTLEFLSIPEQDPSLEAQAGVLHQTMPLEIDRLRLLITQQNVDFELSETEVSLRFQVHRDAFQAAALRQHLQHVSAQMRQKFNRRLAPFDTPIADTFRRAA